MIRALRRASARCALLTFGTVALLLTLHGAGAAAYEFNEPTVRATGPEEMVFDHSTQACQPDDIPDVPARAFRDSQNQIQLVAAHYHARRAIGPTLGSVAHECNVVFGSHLDPDPSKYNGQEWLYSVYTIDGQKVYGFVHQEFHGWDYYEQCAALSGTPDISKCWYNAVTFATSTDAGANYTHATPPGHLLASVPYQFAPLEGPYGVYRPSNVVAKDGLYYMMAVVEGHGAQKSGICLLRTDNLDDPTTWRAWDGSGFGASFINPYVDTVADPAAHVCEPVSSATSGPLRGLELYGLVYNTYINAYMAWGAAMKDPTGKIAGFYYSLSNDLMHWTEPTLLMKAEIPMVSHVCGDPDPVRDASLIDPTTPTRSFETIGRNPYLYMTRFNYFYDGSGNCSMTLDRDLIRIPIEFGASNQSPAASFWLTPSLVQTGQPVTFNASQSNDPDGIIKKFEWDFDENSSFEVDSGATPIVTHSFPSPKNIVTVKLRVTDNRGATGETTHTLGVVGAPQNEVPTASFTATPGVVLSGELVSFDGSGSSDPDGSIANYKWDLDGDGSFETDTGETAVTSRAYLAAGTVTVRLRVTDSGDAAGETSRTVVVNAPVVPIVQPPITAPPQTVFPPPAATGQPSPVLPTCSSIRRQRSNLVKKRNAVRHKLAKAKTTAKKRRYGSQVRALNRKISKLAKTRCSA